MIVDFRSDTVTKPSKAMLEAMMNAPVGDDVFNEDPTVTELEEYTADLFGMEAGLFCPSGTMTNQIAIKTHTQPGDQVICDITSHIYNYETGGIALNSGASVKLINSENGFITDKDVRVSINPDYDWLARTSLVSIENTCNKSGGGYYTLDQARSIATVCKENNLAYHLDGARIFNALCETGDAPSEWGQLFDSISVCLSKGLGAPAGSVLLGSKPFIKNARRFRKAFGGGMRQAGYMAAAGLFALKNNLERLKEDHDNAKLIGKALESKSFVKKVVPVQTNIVIFELVDDYPDSQLIEAFAKKHIKIIAMAPQTIRMVTHLDITQEMMNYTLEVINDL